MTDDESRTVEELRKECARLRGEIRKLRALLGMEDDKQPHDVAVQCGDVAVTAQFSQVEKISLFRNLFRGREDVYPVRWESRNGRTGYSPACVHEWNKKFCQKPRIRCGVCDNRELLPVTEQEVYSQLTRDKDRNDLIFNDLLASLERKSSPLLLIERTEHVEYLAGRLEKFARNVIAMRGGLGKRQRAEIAERIAAIPDGEERVLIATGRYIGEGFDDARLDTLFLAMPISWKGTLQQYAGRLHRLHDRKKTVMVYDYIDSNVPVLMRMYQKRLKGYRAMGYDVAPNMPEYRVEKISG